MEIYIIITEVYDGEEKDQTVEENYFYRKDGAIQYIHDKADYMCNVYGYEVLTNGGDYVEVGFNPPDDLEILKERYEVKCIDLI